MSKYKILTAAACVSLCFALACALPKGVEATAETSSQLFLPTSYEQYLSLSDPSSVAMDAGHIAIADGNVIYLYDRDSGSYSFYTHERAISNLQFSSDGSLYFSDVAPYLYSYSYDDNAATLQSNVPCSTFLIEGDTLYTAGVTGSVTIYAISLSDGFDPAKLNDYQIGNMSGVSETPLLTYSGGTLYCYLRGILYEFQSDGSGSDSAYLCNEEGTVIGTGAISCTSVCAYAGSLYYSVSGGDIDGIYRVSLPLTEKYNSGGTLTQDWDDPTDISSLIAYNGGLYCIKGASVRGLTLTEDGAEYSGYVIAAQSDALNRLNNAEISVRRGNLLVTADSGNSRLQIYNFQSQSYSVIALDSVPSAIATDGDTIAVSIGATISLYRYGETEPYLTHAVTRGNQINGLAVIYGTCYFVTDHSYGAFSEETEEELQRTSSMPSSLAADVWGNLYVADSSGNVTRYTQEEFLNDSASGVTVTNSWTLPSSYSSLTCDFDGNLYYLSEGALYQNGKAFFTPENANSLVYTAESLTPLSFALGYEDNAVYFLYGNFMTKAECDIESLATISCENVAQAAFTVKSAEELTLATVREGATAVQIDLSALTQEAEYFSYLGDNQSAGGAAVVLAQTGKYSLVARYENYDYCIELYLTDDLTASSAALTQTDKTAYLTNAASLTLYPCIVEELASCSLARADEVTVLYEIVLDDGFNFAYVQYQTEDETLYGYVPLSYLVDFSPLHLEGEDFTIGYLKSASYVVFRSGDTRITVTDSIQVRLYSTDQGYYLAEYDFEGAVYTAQVTSDQLMTGNSNVWRTTLIVVLCIVAVGIIIVYVLLIWKNKKKEKWH